MKSAFRQEMEADLISSEAKPKISSALADFILASARISFLQEFKLIRKTADKIFLNFYFGFGIIFLLCGIGISVLCGLPKAKRRVRLPYPAPRKKSLLSTDKGDFFQ